MNTKATEQTNMPAGKSRLVGTALTTLVIISSLLTILCAAIRCKHGANYLAGLPVYIFVLPLVLAAAFFAHYFLTNKTGQNRLNSQCLTIAVSVVLVVLLCDFYSSKEQAIDTGNPHSTDNAKLISYGLFTRRFELQFNGQATETVTVKRTIGKFIGSLPFTATWPKSSYSTTDKFTFNAFNIFGWE